MYLNRYKILTLFEPHKAIARKTQDYRQSQWWNTEQLHRFQNEKIKELINHSWNHVPYYRTLFENQGCIRPEDVVFANIPVLTKEILKKDFENLKSDDLSQRKWFLTKSGGSTGEPVIIVQDKNYSTSSAAKKIINFEWADYRQGEKFIKIWGAEHEILASKKKFRSRVVGYLSNTTILNSFLMTPALMRSHLNAINRIKPQSMLAYAHAICELATFAKANGIPVHSPKSIIATSETLYPFMRQRIEEVFQCPVFDQYGSRELSCIASECEGHDGLHVNAETVHFEIVDENNRPCPPGVEGDILVTSLENFAMPLIRYRIGDRAVWHDKICTCKRSLPLLKKVSGRAMDCFRRRDGSVIPGEYFIHFLGVVFNEGWVKKVQVIQEDYESIRVRIIPGNKPYGPENLEQVKKIVKMVMGENCAIEIQIENSIEVSATGKFRYTICKLPESQ